MNKTDSFLGGRFENIMPPKEYKIEKDIIDGFVLGKDAIDFRDILVGDTCGEIDNYLSVSTDGLNTTIKVSMWGDGDVDRVIVLTNVCSTLDKMLSSNSLLVGEL